MYLKTRDLPDDSVLQSVDSSAPYTTGRGIVLVGLSKSVMIVCG